MFTMRKFLIFIKNLLIKIVTFLMLFIKNLFMKIHDYFMYHDDDILIMEANKRTRRNLFAYLKEAENKSHMQKKERKGERIHKVDELKITNSAITSSILIFSRMEDERFRKSVETDIDNLTREIKFLLHNAKISLFVKPKVNYTKLLFFLATAGRLLAKKQKEKMFILKKRDIELYILLFLKEFDNETQDFIREFVYDLVDIIADLMILGKKK